MLRFELAPSAGTVPHLIGAGLRDDEPVRATRATSQSEQLARGIWKNRAVFGITRIASLTGLDRTGVPVAQAVRPAALSNTVSQGKGESGMQAAASALVECLERWSAQNIPTTMIREASAQALGSEVVRLYEGYAGAACAGWERRPLPWIDGWDLFSERLVPVPLALVDTVYTVPSPHPRLFPRTTTGLSGGRTILDAVLHAALETLEKHALEQAYRRPHFFDHWQVAAESIAGQRSSAVWRRIHDAGFVAGAWLVPSDGKLPIYLCHVMEGPEIEELAPLPAEGSCCGLSHDEALLGALLEACQARAGAISGARDDITRLRYPERYDRAHLEAWRGGLSASGPVRFPSGPEAPLRRSEALRLAIRALRKAGAEAAIVVPLFRSQDPEIEIVRMVAPPLRHGFRTAG
jgi:ribosomal protein S12 methylthiotransferase accessory factor